MKKRRTKVSHRRRKQQKGAGYSDNLKVMLYHGGPEHQPYSGPGYDCAGVPMRPGFITNPASAIPGRGGLPGFAGGGSCKKRKGGCGMYSRRQQKGGRWGAFPELAPLAPNAVGMSGYSPILRQPCELGTRNALNPDPNGIQSLSTYVSSKGIAGWTQTAGGKRRKTRKTHRRRQQGGVSAAALANAPIGVTVGDVDAMRYYSPTAGYSNAPLAPPVLNNPGILMQLGYPARHFNEACMNTK